MEKFKRNAPLLAMIAAIATTGAACTVDEILTVLKIVGLFV